jgi:HEAT repeat protein
MSRRFAWVAVMVGLAGGAATESRAAAGDKPPAPPSVPALVQTLNHSADNAARLQALTDLAVCGPQAEPALPNLLRLLRDQDDNFRLNAALALGKLGKPAVPALVKLLADEDGDVRYHALSALGWVGADAGAAAPAIIKVFADSDAGLRRKAAEALGRIRPDPDATLAVLILVFDDVDETVRDAASAAVARFGARAVPLLLTAIEENKGVRQIQAVKALGHLGPPAKAAIPALRGLLLQGQAGNAEAAAALAGIGRAAVPALVQGVEDEREEVRKLALGALEELGADGAPALFAALDSKHEDVRRHVARQYVFSLRQSRPAARPAVKPLLVALRDPQMAVRRIAARTLSTMDNEGQAMLSVLAELLKEKEPGYRRTAAELLWKCGAAGMPLLKAAFQDEDAKVRAGALASAEPIDGHVGWALPHVAPFLKVGVRDTRALAARVLGRVGPAAAPALLEALKDGEAAVRDSAARSLSVIGPAAAAAYPALLRTLEAEADERVKALVIVVAVRLAPDRAAPLFAAALRLEGDEARRQCFAELVEASMPSPALVPYLIAGLKEGNANTRALAVQGLSDHGALARAAVPALEAVALHDADAPVSEAARAALKRIKGK